MKYLNKLKVSDIRVFLTADGLIEFSNFESEEEAYNFAKVLIRNKCMVEMGCEIHGLEGREDGKER